MKGCETNCCRRFNPKPWDNKKIVWKNKMFVKVKAFCFFHIPLNLGGIIRKNIKKIKEANALPKDTIVLSDEKSLFYSNIYISTKKAIPGVKDIKASGTFLTKVFEGPRENIKEWTKEMKEYVKSQKKEIKNLYYYYTTCPECAELYGENYIVILAEI